MRFSAILSSNFNMPRLLSTFIIVPCWKLLPVIGVILMLSPMPTFAMEPRIQITDSWVEEGYEFYVAFEASPSNASCDLSGEGLIEFEVSYTLARSYDRNVAFGLAIWHPSPQEDDTVFTNAKAIGSQGFCTKISPCRIQNISIVKTWCPISEEQIWPPWGVEAIP